MDKKLSLSIAIDFIQRIIKEFAISIAVDFSQRIMEMVIFRL